jgi:hypothetical protein
MGEQNLKQKAQCSCNEPTCEAYGTVIRNSKGVVKHMDNCICESCRNSNNRKKGTKAQVKIARSMGEQYVSNMHPGNEQNYRGLVRCEIKETDKRHPVATFYDNTKTQSDKDVSIGDSRPYEAVIKVGDRTFYIHEGNERSEIVYRLSMVYGFVRVA